MNVRIVIPSVVGLLFLSGCAWFGESKKVEPKLYLVSVLEKKYFDDAHIKAGAGVEIVNIDKEDIALVSKNWNKNVPVVAYCSNYFCIASDEVAKKLKELGFKDVRVYKGGVAEWYQLSQKDSDYQVAGPAQEGYLKMVVENPGSGAEEVQIIDALELQKSIKRATLDKESK
jgi:rhodanese-related sulfurtransferase